MKYFFLFLFFFTSNAAFTSDLNSRVSYFQSLFNNPKRSTDISESDYNQGDTRPKSILKGVLYIGGSNRRRETLSNSFLNNLCEDGFSQVYSVYKRVNKHITCSNNQFNYVYIGEARENGGGKRLYSLLKYLYNEVINGEKGAVYLHCHYGVHASNTIAQMAQMQFCGISKREAKSNWDTIDLYNSLGEKGRQRQFHKIDTFNPYPEFQINSQQQNQICH